MSYLDQQYWHVYLTCFLTLWLCRMFIRYDRRLNELIKERDEWRSAEGDACENSYIWQSKLSDKTLEVELLKAEIKLYRMGEPTQEKPLSEEKKPVYSTGRRQLTMPRKYAPSSPDSAP